MTDCLMPVIPALTRPVEMKGQELSNTRITKLLKSRCTHRVDLEQKNCLFAFKPVFLIIRPSQLKFIEMVQNYFRLSVTKSILVLIWWMGITIFKLKPRMLSATSAQL